MASSLPSQPPVNDLPSPPSEQPQPGKLTLCEKQYCSKVKHKMKQLLKASSPRASQLLLTLAELTKGRRDQAGIMVRVFVSVFLFWNNFTQPREEELASSQERDEVMVYFAKQMQLNRGSIGKQERVGCYRELLLQGQVIVREIELLLVQNMDRKVSQESLNQESFLKLLLFNNCVCYLQLGMYSQALAAINSLHLHLNEDINSYLSVKVKEFREIIAFKMGKPSKQVSPLQAGKSENNNGPQFLQIMRKSRPQLITFINQLTKQHLPISLSNAYNVCLRCKQEHLYTEGKTLLSFMLAQLSLDSEERLRGKIIILLSQIQEADECFQEAIQSLQRLKGENQQQNGEVSLRIWQLERKIKIKSACRTCPQLSPSTSYKYQLLEELQAKLEKLTAPQSKAMSSKGPISMRKLTSSRYPIMSKAHSGVTTPSSPIPPLLKNMSSKLSVRLQTSQISRAPKRKTRLLKKTVKFGISSQTGEREGLDYIYQCEQKIMTASLDQNHEQVTSLIHSALNHIQDNFAESIPLLTIHRFTRRCINWAEKSGQSTTAINLLSSLIEQSQDNKEFHVSLLHQLSHIYESMHNDKKIIKINLELYRLGEVECLDKVAETYLAKEKFSQAVKYYQMYNEVKPSLYAKVKLAHAYSKICTFSKIATTMLSDLLFENRTSNIYKHFGPEQTETAQNAVLLLASLYMQANGVKKAQDICQIYIRDHFSAYPIFYLLGVISLQYNDLPLAFHYFISALKLKPNHLPSLIQAVRFVQNDQFNKSQVVDITRKALAHHHRNWELLRLFVQLIAGRVQFEEKPTVAILIDCALSIQEASRSDLDLLLEAEIVWLWALDLGEQERGKGEGKPEEQQKILFRLGEINLLKGNLNVSLQFFKNCLKTIRVRLCHSPYRKIQLIKLQLRIFDKMASILLQQSKNSQALQLLTESEELSRVHFLPEFNFEVKTRIEELTQKNEWF